MTPAFACPQCGEAHADRLLIRAADDSIACATCGTVYTVDAAQCHCGAPLEDAACVECAVCAAEWSEYLGEAAEVREGLY